MDLGPASAGPDLALGNDEDEQDEEQWHLASSNEIPRSDAVGLAGLDALGINAAVDRTAGLEEDDFDEGDSQEIPDEEFYDEGVSPPSRVPAQAGLHWLEVGLAPSSGVLQLLQQKGGPAWRPLLHAFIRKVGCHVHIHLDPGLDELVLSLFPGADKVMPGSRSARIVVFASTSRSKGRALELLTHSACYLEGLLMTSDVTIPRDCRDQEDPSSLDVDWDRHPSARSFTHLTVRPSFLTAVHGRTLEPDLTYLAFSHPLDPVQRRCLACVEDDESLLFCAPTSAGKTAVAEYALAKGLRARKRMIYTTPIKALSNQKFLELGKRFGTKRVGIMTGDTVIASDAPVIVMTLEILQAMLYRQARDPTLLDDFACVILDEAHFLGNVDRGYAWEEVVILLPSHIRLVMLSATVPNDETIAAWVACVRVERVSIVRSDQRPVPLIHGLFRCGPPNFFGPRRSFFRVLGSHGGSSFNHRNLNEAARQRREILLNEGAWRCPPGLIGKFIGRQGQNLRSLEEGLRAKISLVDGQIFVKAATTALESEVQARITHWLGEYGVPWEQARDPHEMRAEDLERLLGLLAFRKQLPCIGFCFDRRLCERVALLLTGAKRMDFASKVGLRAAIERRLAQGLSCLEEKDRNLAQVKHSRELLLRGIGVHHSGMLPLLREMVELLFSEGLLPVVFATETFAIGLNMPAKAVIFMDVVKFDGHARRCLDSGEFRQMAGRAGRRGLDKEGHVYLMLHSADVLNLPAEAVLAQLYTAGPPEVKSRYRVRWSSLLHLVSTGPAHLHALLRRSLLSFTASTAAQTLHEDTSRMISALQAMSFVDSCGAALPKGTMACHLFVPDESLLVAEAIVALRGFAGYTAAQIFAICACFVAEGPQDVSQQISDLAVKKAIETCRQVAVNLARELHRHGLACCSRCGHLKDGFCTGFELAKAHVNPNLAETALRWARGEDFTSAVLKSGVPLGGEGVVVRALRRLDELMREVTFVLRHDLGAPAVADAIQATRCAARRGVLAAPSAYLGEAEDRVAEELEPDPPWPAPPLAPGAGLIDPLEIGFSQACCAAGFQQPALFSGPQSILGLAEALADGSVQIQQLPPLEIYWFRHRFYTLGNRRLAAFRLWRLLVGESCQVPVVVVGKARALEREWLKKFSTGFTGGRKIRISYTSRYVGVTREQSTYGQSLWPET